MCKNRMVKRKIINFLGRMKFMILVLFLGVRKKLYNLKQYEKGILSRAPSFNEIIKNLKVKYFFGEFLALVVFIIMLI